MPTTSPYIYKTENNYNAVKCFSRRFEQGEGRQMIDATIKNVFFRFLVEALILLAILFTSIFLRTNLVIGQSLPGPSPVPLSAILATMLVWAAVFLYRGIGEGKKPYKQLLVPLAVFGLTSVQYYFLLQSGMPSSRLLLAYMLVLNLFAVLFAPRLATFAIKVVSDPRVRAVYGQFSEKLYQARAELWLALVIGLLWALYIALMGLSIVGDAFSYMQVAIETTLTGRLEFQQLPPVWPLLLSVWLLITPFLGDAASYFSAISLVLTLVLFAFTLRAISRDSILNIVFLLLLGSLRDFVGLFFYALTEPLYVLLVLAAYHFILLHKAKGGITYYLVALLLAAVASITRFMGVSLVLLVLVYWVLAHGTKNSLRRVPPALLFAFFAFLPFAYLIWLDFLAKSPVSSVPGLAQLEGGQLFIYNIELGSIVDVVVDFFRSFWNAMAKQLYLPASLFVLILNFLRLHRQSFQDRTQFKTNQFFSLLFVLLTLASINFSGSAPVTRYWMPVIPFVYFMFAQAWSNVSIAPRATSLGFSQAYWLFPVLPAVVFGSALLLQINWTANAVSDSLRGRSNQPVHQSMMGFNVSSTAQEFRQFLHQASAEYDHITLFLVDGDEDGQWVSDPGQGWIWETSGFGIDSSVARPFLLKGVLFPESFSAFEFTLFTENEQSLAYTVGDVQKEITLLVATSAPLAEQLESALSRSANAPDQGFFLIANENLFDEASGFQLSDISGHLVQVHEFRPYLIFAER